MCVDILTPYAQRWRCIVYVLISRSMIFNETSQTCTRGSGKIAQNRSLKAYVVLMQSLQDLSCKIKCTTLTKHSTKNCFVVS